MGKKYEAYQKAEQAAGMAKNRFSDVQGGSTKDAYQNAETNAKHTQQVANSAWKEFLDDPEG